MSNIVKSKQVIPSTILPSSVNTQVLTTVNGIAQWANGGGGGGGIGGTGTPGYISLFMDATNIGDSDIYRTNNSYYLLSNTYSNAFQFNITGQVYGDGGIAGSLFLNPTVTQDGTTYFENISLNSTIINTIETTKQIAIHQSVMDGGSVNSMYGLYIEDILAGSINNFSIYTNKGVAHLGGLVEVLNTSYDIADDIHMTITNPDYRILNTNTAIGLFINEYTAPQADVTTSYTGLKIQNTTSSDNGHLNTAYNIYITHNEGIIDLHYGLYMEDITAYTTGYSIFTNKGINSFGDMVELRGISDITRQSTLDIRSDVNRIIVDGISYGINNHESVKTINGISSTFIAENIITTVDAYESFMPIYKALNIESPIITAGYISDIYGIYINDITLGDDYSWAIKTNAGRVQFGGQLIFDSLATGGDVKLVTSDSSGNIGITPMIAPTTSYSITHPVIGNAAQSLTTLYNEALFTNTLQEVDLFFVLTATTTAATTFTISLKSGSDVLYTVSGLALTTGSYELTFKLITSASGKIIVSGMGSSLFTGLNLANISSVSNITNSLTLSVQTAGVSSTHNIIVLDTCSRTLITP